VISKLLALLWLLTNLIMFEERSEEEVDVVF
jgi:hypothetical protein